MANRTKHPSAAARASIPSPVLQGGMARALGVRVLSLNRKKVTGEMRIKPIHINISGRVNGGAIMAFADVLGATGTVANRPPGYLTTTLESKTNFFAAGTGPVLTAVSIPLHIGRSTMVWQTTIKNPDGRTVAIVTQPQILIPARSVAAPEHGKPKKAGGPGRGAKKSSSTPQRRKRGHRQ